MVYVAKLVNLCLFCEEYGNYLVFLPIENTFYSSCTAFFLCLLADIHLLT